MIRISVPTSRKYDVLVESGLLDQTGAYLQQLCKQANTIAIISDTNVWPLYGERMLKSLTDAGFQVIFNVFPAGEASKNAITYLDILNFLAVNHITRIDALIALGGGVVGDITGFAAATYLRGIAYIQIPTSLLAMVDSSVGGKTAIDLPAGKNLVGAFYQPSIVLCDPSVLSTLPQAVFADGCAEVIKYSMLYDKNLFDQLMADGPDFDRESVIGKCISLKRDVVCMDEFDAGLRQKLNLGHSIGHAVEAQSNFEISHGQAVAIGMVIVTRAAVAKGLCSADVLDKLQSVLNKFRLPISTEYSASQLFNNALSDKKRSGSSINLIVPRAIGNCEIIPTPVTELESFIQEGL